MPHTPEGMENTEAAAALPQSLVKRLPLRWEHTPGAVQDRLARAVSEAKGETLIATEGQTIIDARLLCYAADHPGSYAALGGEEEACTALLRLDTSVLDDHSTDQIENAQLSALATLAQQHIMRGQIQELSLTDVPSYITKLRRDLPIYLFRVADTHSRDEAERFLFWSNYKGSSDLFTKYVYPPLVWLMVRPLARWRVHPNVVTAVSIILTFVAVPLFAQAYWISGFVCAFGMSVLDSVDGKLARLTFRSSKLGDWLDHGLDIVHPPLWYAAWAWALGNGNTDSLVFHAAVWMTIVYILDRIVAAMFSWRHGRSIHGYTPLDERMRTFISRRNINTPLFLVGLLAGVAIPVFYIIVVWQVVSFLFHTERLVQFWNDTSVPQAQ
jgi:phosphatidylglycerophosphate synthase